MTEPLNNSSTWSPLEHEIERLTLQCLCMATLIFSELEFSNSVLALNSLPPLGKLLQQLQKANQIYLYMGTLLETFKAKGVVVIPKLAVPEHGCLDLLVRFPIPPKKVNFAIALRTQTNSKVIYHEQQKVLLRRRKAGGLKRWEPDPIKQISMQESWLRNHQIELFGPSSKDKNRPLIKLLVLTATTTLGEHSEHLYTTVGNVRVLLIRRQSSIYVMQDHQLIPFIQSWLENP